MNESFDPIDIVGQSKQAEQSALQRKKEREGQIEDFKWLMGDQRGRRFIWRLLEKAGVYRSSFTGNSSTFFNEGQRNMGLMVIGELHAICPELYVTMIKENSSNGSKPASS